MEEAPDWWCVMGVERKPRVLNKRTDKIPLDAVYVGRPTKWGNPFVIGKPPGGNTRAEVLDRYNEYLHTDGAHLRREAVSELRGKDLVCWCTPLPCHADVLLEIANANEDTE